MKLRAILVLATAVLLSAHSVHAQQSTRSSAGTSRTAKAPAASPGAGHIDFDDLMANESGGGSRTIFAAGAANAINAEVESHGERHNATLSRKRASSSSSGTEASTGPAWVSVRRIGKSAWWNEGGTKIRCQRGRHAGDERDVFVDKNGMWEAVGHGGGKQRSLDAAAQWACSLN